MTHDDVRKLAAALDDQDGKLLRALADVVEAGKQLLANIEDYQRINNLGGSDNHDQVCMRAALARVEALKP